MLKKIPRPFFIIDHYFYPILAAIIVLIVLLLLNNADGLSLGDWVILAALVVLFALVWWVLRPRQSKNVLSNATAMMREIRHSHKHALIAFESEFCLKSMLLRWQAGRLQAMHHKNFTVYRISVNREPGRTLFKQFDGHITPTYVLVDPKGNVVTSSAVLLPKDRVMYAVTRPPQPT